ncbi:hypothetical protein QJS10_CPA16g00539 [Acorus calamus]|uniref:Uncharacterized protein n=1 Tax=Acorus calamus TaxID=4465 RepID=A0AAV9D1E6_ACOCL|nr:hypothetical protein QJS10_CPA16g00539 [Acorus calamus]
MVTGVNRNCAGNVKLVRFSLEEHYCIPTMRKSSSRQRKTRGPTRCLGMHGLPEGERIAVPLNELRQPVDEEGCALSQF